MYPNIYLYIQGPPYISGHSISSPTAVFDHFMQKWWQDAIFVRFKWLFCRIVHYCDILGSRIILENIKIIFSKFTQITKSTRSKLEHKIRHPNDRFFISNFVYLGFWLLRKCTKNLVALSLNCGFLLMSNFC